MIGFNPTPELRELLTHHHKRHKNIHIQPNNQLQIKKQTHEILHWSQISSRNAPLRVETATANETLKTTYCLWNS